MGRATPAELRDGIVGSVLLAGYVLQTVGLHTTAATSAFITSCSSCSAVRRVGARKSHPLTLVGVVLAVAGLVLLTGGADAGFGRGEVLTLDAPGVRRRSRVPRRGQPRHDPVRLTTVQLTTVGAACLVPALAQGSFASPGGSALAAAASLVCSPPPWRSSRWCGPSGSSARRGPRLLLLEPVFAALLSALIDEPLTAAVVAGGGLILLPVLAEVVAPMLEPHHRRRARLTADERTVVAPRTLALEASARRIGHYCWIEMRTFEILGAWTGGARSPRSRRRWRRTPAARLARRGVARPAFR